MVGAETAPPLNLVERPLTGRARITPMMPAANASADDSARNDVMMAGGVNPKARNVPISVVRADTRSEEHTSELQSQSNLVCRLLLEKKKKKEMSTHVQEHD